MPIDEAPPDFLLDRNHQSHGNRLIKAGLIVHPKQPSVDGYAQAPNQDAVLTRTRKVDPGSNAPTAINRHTPKIMSESA